MSFSYNYFPYVYFSLQASLALASDQSYSVASGKLPFPPPALVEAVRFLQGCLGNSAGVTVEQMLTNQTLPAISTYLTQVVKTGKSKEVMKSGW